MRNEVTHKLSFEGYKCYQKLIQENNHQDIWKHIELLLPSISKCCIKKVKFGDSIATDPKRMPINSIIIS